MEYLQMLVKSVRRNVVYDLYLLAENYLVEKLYAPAVP